MNDDRVTRDRHESLYDSLDRSQFAPPDSPGSILLKTTTDVTYPSGTNQIVICNPVLLDGDQSEGSTETPSADTTIKIPAVLVGGSPPAVGSYVVAHSVGGRWCIGSGSGTSVFFCKTPASGSWGATWTGTVPTTAGDFMADVYAVAGASATLAEAGATVYNWFPSSPPNSRVIEVFSDSSGAYVTGPASCS